MPKKTDPYGDLQKQIETQIDLIEEIAADPDPSNRLERLDASSRAILNILRSLKILHELSAAAADPSALLRQALTELEAEWPELFECKKLLHSGGAVTPTEADHAAQA
jgi:hypothetical protein